MSHQTFWKPEKVEKVKAQNSLQQRKPKERKEQPEWKRGILSHHLSNPSRADRAEFPRDVITAATERSGGICQYCKKVPCTTTHHVKGRGGRDGRGVLSNAFRCCGKCHIEIEGSEEKKQEIIQLHRRLYGDNFWFDEQDWEEYNRKQASSRIAEDEQKQRMQRINPIVELLSVAAGRKLKVAEIRVIDGMDDREVTVFAKLMAEVVSAGMVSETAKVPFGYCHFDD